MFGAPRIAIEDAQGAPRVNVAPKFDISPQFDFDIG